MLDEVLNEIEQLKMAKKLLDDILVYYDIYGYCFDNERLLEEKTFRIFPDLISTRIRKYLKFDDSE
jgi:hypothetical protein